MPRLESTRDLAPPEKSSAPISPELPPKNRNGRFQPDHGLRLLMINPPIREWSYPNIMPIGQGYVGSVARMDGHHLDVLDLNALRKEPVKGDPQVFSKWVEAQVIKRLEERKPEVIGIGGIIT